MCDTQRYVATKEVHTNYIEYVIKDMLEVNDSGDMGEVIVTGSVKWDGCSNWDMRPEEVMLHFCDVEQMDALYKVIRDCYKEAEQHFHFDD